MGREVRRVPQNWEHPKDADGSYKPLFKEAYAKACQDWKEGFLLWENKQDPYADKEDYAKYEYWDYAGMPPEEKYYSPDWKQEERTHYQMYETTSEGTPISPVKETPEQLAKWLTDHGASSFADRTATYDQWLSMIGKGLTFSAVLISGKGLISGVEASERIK